MSTTRSSNRSRRSRFCSTGPSFQHTHAHTRTPGLAPLHALWPARLRRHVDGTATTVQVAGLTGNATPSPTTFACWQRSAASAMGVTATQVWNAAKDLVLSATNSLGRKATTIYDPATDRATDVYGPAPAACYGTDRRPVANPVAASGCGVLPAHLSTVYDGGLNGLQATYHPNMTLAASSHCSPPASAGPGGSVDRNWSTASPAAASKWTAGPSA